MPTSIEPRPAANTAQPRRNSTMIGCRSAPVRSLSLTIVCALVLPLTVRAQETRATVTGTVKDTQGAVVPGVTVTVLNVDTNVSTETVTNDVGVFTAQRIQPGPVKVTATLPGFKTFVREGITLR